MEKSGVRAHLLGQRGFMKPSNCFHYKICATHTHEKLRFITSRVDKVHPYPLNPPPIEVSGLSYRSHSPSIQQRDTWLGIPLQANKIPLYHMVVSTLSPSFSTAPLQPSPSTHSHEMISRPALLPFFSGSIFILIGFCLPFVRIFTWSDNLTSFLPCWPWQWTLNMY